MVVAGSPTPSSPPLGTPTPTGPDTHAAELVLPQLAEYLRVLLDQRATDAAETDPNGR